MHIANETQVLKRKSKKKKQYNRVYIYLYVYLNSIIQMISLNARSRFIKGINLRELNISLVHGYNVCITA